MRDKCLCEDIVQNVFVGLWENRQAIKIETSLKSFLLKSVRNGCMDELRHEKTVWEYEAYLSSYETCVDIDTEGYVLYSNLKEHLDEALEKLPEVYRKVFVMNRFEGLKYKEIAQKAGISERTVEVRIGKALGLLRTYLKDFLIIALILILFIIAE